MSKSLLPSRVLPVSDTWFPSTYQAWESVTVSPSSSVVIAEAVIVSAVYTVTGLRLTLVTVGGVFTVTVFEATASPLSSASSGVMVQKTVEFA